LEMSNDAFLVRLTQIFRYSPDNVQLGAVFLNHRAGAHRIIILTTQNKLNCEPKVGQQWEITKELNYAVRQQEVSPGVYVNVWRFMEPKLKCVMPDNGSGFVAFLSAEKKFRGIGKVKAQLLWDAFRSDIFTMLCEKPDTPYKHDKTITNFDAIKIVLIREEVVSDLYKGFESYRNLRYSSQLVEWEIEEPIQRQIFRFADKDALTFLKENPYRLFSLGMRFQKVDMIAQKHFKISECNDIRLTAIVEYALRQWADNGHTVASWEDIKPTVSRLLNNDHQLTEKASQLTGDIIGFTRQADNYFVSGNYIFEKTIAKRFHSLSAKKRYWLADLDDAYNAAIPDGWVLEKAQALAVRMALVSHIFALSGGAGTGKTTTTRIIVDAYRRLGFTIYPVALSGKAARRFQQSIGIKTSTIARLLKEKHINDTNCVLMVDEASMLDAYTMWRLVTLFSNRTRIILIGDPHQLPPINAGFVLNDVIKSGVINHVELDVVRRQAATSSVPAYSQAIRNGQLPAALTTREILFQEPVNNLIEDAVAAYTNYDSAMIIAATNATVRTMNEKLQASVNPDGELLDLTDMPVNAGNYTFRKGDPVVITLTRYTDDVQNGMLGVVTAVCPNEKFACTIELDDLDENGYRRSLNVDWELFEYLDLAYCLTLHKLQGSQAKNIIVILERGWLLDRSWLYTAVTRAESTVHIIGREIDFLYAVDRKGATDTRKTALAEMLKSECNMSCKEQKTGSNKQMLLKKVKSQVGSV